MGAKTNDVKKNKTKAGKSLKIPNKWWKNSWFIVGVIILVFLAVIVLIVGKTSKSPAEEFPGGSNDISIEEFEEQANNAIRGPTLDDHRSNLEQKIDDARNSTGTASEAQARYELANAYLDLYELDNALKENTVGLSVVDKSNTDLVELLESQKSTIELIIRHNEFDQ